ncbi:MAG: diaminopimelate decarboxylase [Solirubrobacteraceae bacterium]|nr:diaminopimelate decarboxylase [Solirubrobacteraceae bacterium]
MAAATLTVYPEAASVHEGRLAIGGCDVIELAREFGTPAYVVAEDDLRARAREFLRAMAAHHGGPGEVAFASKAFPCTEVLRIFRQEGLAVDVASAGELHLARRAGYEPAEIIFHGNAKSEAELAEIARLGVTCVVDNLDEIDRLDGHAGDRLEVMLRVVPEVQTDTHHAVATGHADQKFGLSLDEARAALERLGATSWAVVTGIHMHIGSQLFDLAPYREAIAAIAALGDFDGYDLGGGLAVPYTAEHRTPSVEEWVAGVVDAAHDLLGARGKKLTIEPGRALVANAGVTLYTVESVKRRESVWVAVDGGMSDNLRPMLYGAPYSADVADRLGSDAEPGERCHLAGKHCESGDVIAWGVRLRDPRPGDVVVTPVTGAYGHAMANNYNGVPRPPVILCAGGEARVAVRRETLEDLVARDV